MTVSRTLMLFAILAATPHSASALPSPGKGVSGSVAPQEIFLDSIVASVNEKPITLHELCSRLHPPRELSLREASTDPEARQLLEMIIQERLIQEEAESKKIGVSDEELDSYLNEVAQRNNLSREGFEAALKNEGRNIQEYRRQIKTEILRSKLASTYIRGGVSVAEEEIDSYIDSHPELSRDGSKIQLSQILVSVGNRDEAEAKTRAEEALAKIEAGDSFADVAREYSDAPEAREGGSLGMIAEKDLGPQIFDAVLSLKDGQTSPVVRTDVGFQIFRIDQRLSTEDEAHIESLREEVRKTLQQQKVQAKMQDFFANELYKLYPVDKKI